MSADRASACAGLSKAEMRKQSQQDRILAAAMRCFIKSGFHCANMVSIAEAADMSPGLIYRYFENKNAIILAIIRQQIMASQCRIRDIRDTDDLSDNIVAYFESRDEDEADSMSVPLFFEMSAEATRDPDVAKAISEADQAVRRELAEWFGRSKDEGGLGFAPDEARERCLALILLVDGVKTRKLREPKLDRACLKKAVDRIVAAVTG